MEELSKHPELIFGLVAPIGVDLTLVETKLRHALVAVGYEPSPIRITELMKQIPVEVAIEDTNDPFRHYASRIEYANSVREKCGSDGALAALAIHRIRKIRHDHHISRGETDDPDKPLSDRALSKRAYVIRQFKRKEEIDLMRQVYGRKFIQISAHANVEERIVSLARKAGVENPSLSPDACREFAKKLVDRDLHESAVERGQRVGDIFHLGDVFVDAENESSIEKTVRRFVEAFFGKNSISPTRDEYGTYIAASASFRSLDTSRQVGAAIFTKKTEVIALGSNEVPCSGGGTYWEDDASPHRDFDEGHDANSTNKQRVLFDIVSRLRAAGFLNTDKSESDFFKEISEDREIGNALIHDITEYGRMVHAEMNAITDAARLGRSIQGATLYCTTFPCHNCAKHIVASGIMRVVFIEPYPKSKAIELHYDSIKIEGIDDRKVVFEHFNGISPRRYRDIFEKQKRRNKDGSLSEWYDGEPAPRIEDRGAFHVLGEPSAILSALALVYDDALVQKSTDIA